MELEFGIKDIIDILLVAVLLYETYRLLKGTNAINVFMGVVAFVLCWFLVSHVFKMELLGAILDKVMSVGAVALVVIFQGEIRRFFSHIGRRGNHRFLRWMNHASDTGSDMGEGAVMQLVLACRNMSRNKCGALIVIEGNADLNEFTASGETVNATINSQLIENIFFKNSPLHDGAMIISGKIILAVGCILPVSQNPNLPKRLGLRHRAALGISERTDAMAIIVSEETGRISIVHHGNLTADVSTEQLERLLSKEH